MNGYHIQSIQQLLKLPFTVLKFLQKIEQQTECYIPVHDIIQRFLLRSECSQWSIFIIHDQMQTTLKCINSLTARAY